MTMLTTGDGVELAVRTWSAIGEARAAVVLVHGLAATKDNHELIAVATALAPTPIGVKGPSPPNSDWVKGPSPPSIGGRGPFTPSAATGAEAAVKGEASGVAAGRAAG